MAFPRFAACAVLVAVLATAIASEIPAEMHGFSGIPNVKFDLEAELAMTMDFRDVPGRERRALGDNPNMLLLENSRARSDGAMCLDGSRHKFYADIRGSNKWIILLEPGGVCFGKDDCLARAQTSLGTSTQFRDIFEGQFTMSPNKDANPYFWDWNKVFIPYCSGDAFSGTRTVKDAAISWDLVFTGHINVMSVIQELMGRFGMASATEIIFSGQSAGGVGVFLNIDAVAKLVAPIPVKGLADSGWFNSFMSFPEFAAGSNAPAEASAIVAPFRLLFNYVFVGTADDDCIAAYGLNDKGFCMHGHRSAKYVSTPMFVMAHRWDTYVLGVFGFVPLPVPDADRALYAPYLKAAGNYMRDTIQQFADTTPKTNGYYLSDCYAHVYAHSTRVETFDYKVRDIKAYQSFVGWYFGTQPWYMWRLVDTINDDTDSDDLCNGSCCNPSYCFGTCANTPAYGPADIWKFAFDEWQESFDAWKAGQCAAAPMSP